jgi:hypothetical protein
MAQNPYQVDDPSLRRCEIGHAARTHPPCCAHNATALMTNRKDASVSLTSSIVTVPRGRGECHSPRLPTPGADPSLFNSTVRLASGDVGSAAISPQPVLFLWSW